MDEYKDRSKRPWLAALRKKLNASPQQIRPITCERCHNVDGQLVKTLTGYAHPWCIGR